MRVGDKHSIVYQNSSSSDKRPPFIWRGLSVNWLDARKTATVHCTCSLTLAGDAGVFLPASNPPLIPEFIWCVCFEVASDLQKPVEYIAMATLRWTDDDTDDRTVVAYEPVRRPITAVQRRRSGRLRIFKARLTLSFSIYVISGGTLLTLGTFLLSGILFLVGFLALGFSACVAATWLCFNKAMSLATTASKKLLPKSSTTSLAAPPSPPPLPASNGGLQHVD